VIWQDGANRVIVSVDGWVVCNLDLQSDATGRQTLQFVFFLGKSADGDGLHAAATMNLSTPQAAQLGDVWGASLQRVLWDAVLDVVEAAVAQVATQKSGQALTLQGFSCSADAIHVAILAGDN
jgi:hypothetical protein